MMTDLIIRNFAIIEHLHVTFEAGFTVLTGETGAGKSIIIDAVSLLLGGRARGDVIRSGAESASVEAVFKLSPDAPLQQRLQAVELADGEDLVVRRILSRSGKNRAFINGSVVPANQLRELIGDLINIYGQHEHQTLQRPEMHLALLDQFAGLDQELTDYRRVYAACRAAQQELETVAAAERQRHQRLDYLNFVRQELQAATLQPNEDQDLEQERCLLLHAEKLTGATQGGYENLYASEGAVCEIVAQLTRQLAELGDIDPSLGVLSATLQDTLYSLEDVALQLRDYAEKLDFEPQRQQQVEERLALLDRLKRKYAPSVAELLDHLEMTGRELKELQNIDGKRERLQQNLQQYRTELTAAAQLLTEKRCAAAGRLNISVETELAELSMPQARFRLKLFPLESPGENGQERGEFYLAANPGEAEQPLAKIASGGELSRIMLALRNCAPLDNGLTSLVFDEVDAGIGGEAATAVGRKIALAAVQSQVLCVTHLPQVAAFADHHYRVTKTAAGGRTTTCLTALDAPGRNHEMARMLGGSHAGEKALIHARELIKKSRLHI